MDAKDVFDWVAEPRNNNLHHTTLIMECRTLSTKYHISHVRVKYCFHKANQYADAMTRKEPELSQDFVMSRSSRVNICLLFYCADYVCIIRDFAL